MDIEIRRNRDISFNVTCENPESLKELFPEMTEEQKNRQDLYEKKWREFCDEFWEQASLNRWKDLDGLPIREDTHELGWDAAGTSEDGYVIMGQIWVRPKKSEYEK